MSEERPRAEEIKEASQLAQKYIEECGDYGIRLVLLAMEVLKIPPSVFVGALKVAMRIVETKDENGKFYIEKSGVFLTEQVMDIIIEGESFEVMAVENGPHQVISAAELRKPKAEG